ncbi:Uncharacterized protein DBV15_10266 [Temnothorax longispinosus]|uniref:Uncharacterized protein n=1 Tax=Temnothorax longispinosus TaxID=300112 RepID=A0A4S2KSG1_9HYME|nr:Uncharacterized protein DBV15_10266 [Temnothorax longispinosus]
MSIFESIKYSDRFTPVLLIVSLAGIKVCSPDGKVSTRDAHTVTHVEKGYLGFVRGRCYGETVLPLRLRHLPRQRVSSPGVPREKTLLLGVNAGAMKNSARNLIESRSIPAGKFARAVRSSFQSPFYSFACLPLRENEFERCVQMAHALRRISYATCEPQHAQFSFLAREPRAHFSQQYCHSFITESAEQVPAAGTGIPKEVCEHSRYGCSLQEIYPGVLHITGHGAARAPESKPKSAIERRVALTAGQRTRIANSCAPCGAGSLSSGVLGRGRVKRIRSRGKDRERDGERPVPEREGLTDRP